jgi:hypothetical protein
MGWIVMKIETTIGEDERAVIVEFDYEPASGDGFHEPREEAQVMITQVYCVRHFEETGLKADEAHLLSDDEEGDIVGLCWEAVKDAEDDYAASRADDYEARRQDRGHDGALA